MGSVSVTLHFACLVIRLKTHGWLNFPAEHLLQALAVRHDALRRRRAATAAEIRIRGAAADCIGVMLAATRASLMRCCGTATPTSMDVTHSTALLDWWMVERRRGGMFLMVDGVKIHHTVDFSCIRLFDIIERPLTCKLKLKLNMLMHVQGQ